MHANQKHKISAAIAPIAAGALLFTGAAVGASKAGTIKKTSNGTVVTQLANTSPIVPLPAQIKSDLSLEIALSSHPAHSLCANTYDNTNRLPAGCPIVSVLTVTNHASTPATNIVLTAPQPGGWINPVVERPATGCALDANEDLECKLGTLQPGASTQVVVEGTTATTADAFVMSSVARVTADGIEATPEDNVATDILIMQPEANLSVVTQPHTGAVVPGSSITWNTTVTNDGPSAADNVRMVLALTDAFDAMFTDVSVTTSDGSPATCKELLQNGNTGRCIIDNLAVGASATMTVTGTISSDLSDTSKLVGTTAGVSSHTTDPDPANNTAQSAVMITVPRSTLLMGVDGPNSVAVGEKATWTFTIENAGPSDSTDTRLLLSIPKGLQDVQVTSNHGTCSLTECELGTLLSSADPTMPGNTAEVSVSGVVKSALGRFSISGNLTSESVGTGSVLDAAASVTVDATRQVEQTNEPQADMEIRNFRITPLDESYTGPGSQRRIQFEVTNNGPAPALYPWFRLGRSTDATANLSNMRVEQTPTLKMQDLCQTTSRELMCALTDTDRMAVGETVQVDYTITLDSMGKPGNFPDYVNVYSSTTADPNELNNNAQADIVIGESRTELSVSVEPTETVPNYGSPGTPGSMADPDKHPSFIAGDAFHYEIDVTVPAGNVADASGVRVVAVLPAGFIVDSAVSADGHCYIGQKSRVNCTLPTVSAGSSSTIMVSGTLTGQANDLHDGDSWAEQVPMTVTATSDTLDKSGSMIIQSGITHVDVVESADLVLFVTPDEAGTSDDNSIGYTLTALNTGMSGVEHAAVTAVIPEGYVFDAHASDCVAPTNSEFDVNGDGKADMTPLAPGFAPGTDTAIICLVGEVNHEYRTGILDAGESGNVRVVFRKAPGATQTASDMTFVIGSLAYDPYPDDNNVTVSLTSKADNTVGSGIISNPIGKLGTNRNLPIYERFIMPDSLDYGDSHEY